MELSNKSNIQPIALQTFKVFFHDHTTPEGREHRYASDRVFGCGARPILSITEDSQPALSGIARVK